MKYSEAIPGRIFVIRLEDGEIIHEKIEEFARQQKIKCASVTALGGIDSGSILITGPEEGRADKIIPSETILHNVYEVTGTGTIFPDKKNIPVLHLHIACGRKDKTITGCVRRGVKVWHIFEVIVTEIINCTSARLRDKVTGFDLLIP